MRRFRGLLTLGLVVVLGLNGCGAPEPMPHRSAQPVPEPRPPGVVDPVTQTSAPAENPSCEDPRASLRPTGEWGPSLDRIRSRNRLVVGVDQNTYLFGFRGPDGQLAGFDVDLAREIAEDFFGDRNHIQFRALTASQRVEAIRSGQVDMVVRMTTMTCERWQEMAFSTEYLTAGQSVLVPAGSPVESIDDLRGERVCAALGSTSLSVLVEHPAGLIAVGAPSAVDCLVMLQQGQVAAVSTDNTILAGFVAQDPQVRVVGEPFTDEPYGIAMAPDAEDLVRYVNGVLERLRADGTWARLYDRWLAPHLGPAAPPQPRYRD